MTEKEGVHVVWAVHGLYIHCLRQVTPVSQPKDRILIKKVTIFNLPTIYYYLDMVFDKNLTEKKKKNLS